jgi:hypothetical protein
MKVGLMILGAQKCGTTTLFEALAGHPQMNGCRLKEPGFFCSAKDWRAELDGYHALYDDKPGTISFEASPSYTFYPLRNLHLWDDLHEYNPHLRFVYLVRHPVDRIVSAYVHMYERGWTDLPLPEAILRDPSLIRITRYHTQISPYVERFGRDRVLLLEFSELTQRRDETLRRIAGFLDIDPAAFDPNVREVANAAAKKTKLHHRFDQPAAPLRLVKRFAPPLWRRITDNSHRAILSRPALDPELEDYIWRALELEIQGLEGLLGRSLDAWRPDHVQASNADLRSRAT